LIGQENLRNFYQTNFALVQHHKYSLSDIENMIPFEREVYLMLLSQHISEENLKIQEQQAMQSAQSRRR